MGHCQGIVWLRTQGESSLSFFLTGFPFLFFPASLSLSFSLSFHFDLEPLLFYYFQTRHFFSKTVLLFSLSFSLSLSFSPSLGVARRGCKKYVENRTVKATGLLRRIINVDY